MSSFKSFKVVSSNAISSKGFDQLEREKIKETSGDPSEINRVTESNENTLSAKLKEKGGKMDMKDLMKVLKG